ncbi:MAG: ABC transporter ATP-binding protein [Spirochaetaceae bacterium]|nr:ABC transporter ATP-binding protein [Spirochaetaceae bacterium]
MSTILDAQGVCKYFGGLKAVENVSMSIQWGDIFGIIGPNGAGKTTFFNICSGIYTPTKGTVFLDGENITTMRSESIARKGLARTFQNIKLFKHMTVLENVTIGFHINTKTTIIDAVLKNKRYREDEKFIVERGLQILEQVGLLAYKDTHAGNLAYGIQRKVEIARALATDPKILLLDEPAAGMNPNETMGLVEFIKTLNARGYTIAVIEHDMKFVMNSCNHVLVLNFGEKICEGSPDEVKADKAVQEAYFGKGFIAGGAAYA